MSWSSLRTDIQTLINEISGIAEVSPLPKLSFKGFPAVTITPSDLSSDYETKQENLRTYSFQVRVFYETKNTGLGQAINKVEETVDAIIDKLDQEEKHGATRVIGASLGDAYTILDVVPVIGPWGYVEGQELVVAELSVRIRLSFDIEA